MLENPRPLSFAANVNLGIARRAGEYVLNVEPRRDRGAGRGRRARRVRRRASALRNRRTADALARRDLAAVAPAVPDRRGTIVRRTPLRRLRPPYETQREHYALDERPTEPVQADWMLGAFLLMRRTMLDEIGGWDAGLSPLLRGHRPLLPRGAGGWERWYVPDAVVTHAYAAVIDQRFLSRHTLWHARGMARFVRKHPERLLAL